jgi:transcriptional regulator with XRE-family HTH domain
MTLSKTDEGIPKMPGQHIGPRLKSFRKQKGLTVSETAARAGVSAGMISQIERGLSNPSVRVLERLRMALDVPLTALIDSASGTTEVQASELVRRHTERPLFTVGHNGMSKELLSPNGDHDMQFMIITVAPRSSSLEVLIGPGEKAGLMLAGELELRVGERNVLLQENDSFQFSSHLPHSIHNHSDEAAKVLWIMNTKKPALQF